MTDIDGKEIFYNNSTVNHEKGLLVTNGILHDKILQALSV